jgi:hypothetical protein
MMTRWCQRMNLRMVPHLRGPAGRDRLQDRSRMLHEELGQIVWQGEQVYRMPVHNGLASRVIIDQLICLLPKDKEDLNL